MKKTAGLISIFFLLSIASFSQEGLLVRNIRNGKAWMYEKNARVTYILFGEQEYRTSILNELLDSSVVFGKDTIPLKRISGVRKKNPVHNFTRIAGIPLMLVGSLFMGQGAASVYSNPDTEGGIKFFLLGAGIFALGYVPYELTMEDLTVGFDGKWTIEIFRGEAK